MDFGLSILLGAIAIIIAISIHEFSHALAAYLLGDNTAKQSGRLSLNPVSHIDLWGTVIIPIVLLISSGGAFVFGWAKPVPYNPYNLKYQRFGPAIVGFAGPLANIILGVICLIAVKLLMPILDVNSNLLMIFLFRLAAINIILMLFNLIPIPPLDGSKILFALLHNQRFAKIRLILEQHGIQILFIILIGDWILNLNLLSRIFMPIIKGLLMLIL